MLKNIIRIMYRAMIVCIVTVAIISPLSYAKNIDFSVSEPVKTTIITKLNSEQQILATKYAFDFVGSTQTWSKEHPENIPKDGWMIVTAKKQFAGVGTGGRIWHSPAGNIYVTFSRQMPEIRSLTIEQKLRMKQVVALAVVQTLESLGLKPQIKWSNDVLLNKKKISGVLDEIHDDILTIGIGFNINMNQQEAMRVNEVCIGDPNRIPATSLLIEEEREFDMEVIFQELQKNFYINMDLLLNNKFNEFIKQIASRLTCKIGDEVTVQPANQPELNGRFVGLNEYGSAMIGVVGKGVITVDDGRIALNSSSVLISTSKQPIKDK